MKKKKFKVLGASLAVLIVAGLIILHSKGLIFSNNSNDNNSKEQVLAEDKNTDEDNTSKETNKKVSLDGFLFVGDSYTYLLSQTIQQNNPTALISAKSGVQPGYWLENFSTLPANDDVNGVVLLIGVNGVTFDDNLPNKEKLIDLLVEKYEGKTIYVQKVFPVGKDFTSANPESFNNAIKNHNEKIEEYCKKYDNVIFIDSTKDLVTEDGYLKYTYDGLHIEPEKQDVFYNNIKDAVNNVK